MIEELRKLIEESLLKPDLSLEDIKQFYEEAKWEENKITYADIFKDLGYKLATKIYEAQDK